MYRIRVAETFEASHCIEKHKGRCSNPHGHTYTVEVFLTGTELDKDTGILYDFSALKHILKTFIKKELDHQDLNISMKTDKPSAEVIAAFVYGYLTTRIDMLEKVRIWEGKNSYAEYYES